MKNKYMIFRIILAVILCFAIFSALTKSESKPPGNNPERPPSDIEIEQPGNNDDNNNDTPGENDENNDDNPGINPGGNPGEEVTPGENYCSVKIFASDILLNDFEIIDKNSNTEIVGLLDPKSLLLEYNSTYIFRIKNSTKQYYIGDARICLSNEIITENDYEKSVEMFTGYEMTATHKTNSPYNTSYKNSNEKQLEINGDAFSKYKYITIWLYSAEMPNPTITI